jgi:hypothetical protein
MNKRTNSIILVGIIALILLAVAWLAYWQVSRLIVSGDRNRYQQSFTDISEENNLVPDNTSKPVISSPTANSNLNSNRSNQTKKTTLKKISEGKRYTNYEGSITISGRYAEYNPETMLGGYLCFTPDDKTGYLIPREPDFWGPDQPDTREPWFCFADQTGAKKLFGINDKAIFQGDNPECVSGPATVTVSHYVTDKLESETFDKAQLDKVISFQKYSSTCPQ